MKTYADSSFIVSLFLKEEYSLIAFAFMQKRAEPLPFNPWHRLEVRNSIRLAVFRGNIDSDQGKLQLKQIETDLRHETVITHMPLEWVTVLREAEKLGAAHSESIGCRSGDLFHIAAALNWNADLFLTFDERQKKMAKAAGLNVAI